MAMGSEEIEVDPLAARKLAENTGVEIILGLTVPRDAAAAGLEALTRQLLEGLRYGIAGTTVRAGMLGTIRTSSAIQPGDITALRAAARSQVATGVGVAVELTGGLPAGLRVLDTLQAEGVDLRRVALRNTGEPLDYASHCSLAVRGAWLLFGKELAYEDGRAGLRRLLQGGWAGQILVSCPLSLVRTLQLPPATTDELLVLNPPRFLSG